MELLACFSPTAWQRSAAPPSPLDGKPGDVTTGEANGGMAEKLRVVVVLLDPHLEKRDIFRLEVNQEHMKARPKSFSEQIRENSSRSRN